MKKSILIATLSAALFIPLSSTFAANVDMTPKNMSCKEFLDLNPKAMARLPSLCLMMSPTIKAVTLFLCVNQPLLLCRLWLNSVRKTKTKKSMSLKINCRI